MPTPFPPNKTIKELGIDTTREFVVVSKSSGHLLNVGDILKFCVDDNTTKPFFMRESDGMTAWIALSDLAYADEPTEKKEPYVPRVGDRIQIEGVVNGVSYSDDFIIIFDGDKFPCITPKEVVERAILISRAPRILTKSEAEKLLKEKLGEDVTIEV